MSDNSYIKLFRSLLDWEWWDNKNVTRLFLTILLSVNWEDKSWHGMVIEHGTMFTSLNHLSKKSGLTLQQTRTALKKLISTGEITTTPTSKGTLVRVENWGKFQHIPEKVTSEITDERTDEQQTSNKQVTNDQQQLKNIKNIRNKESLSYAPENVKIGEQYCDPVTGRLRMRVR